MSLNSKCLKKEFNHDVGTLGNICNKPILIFGFLIKWKTFDYREKQEADDENRSEKI